MAVKEIVPNVYAISLSIVNAFVIDHNDGLTLIDTGIPGSADKIIQAVQELGKQPTDIRHILVTHCHADHTGSLAALKEISRAPAYMHPLDAAMVRQGESMRPAKPGPSLAAKLMVRLLMRGGPSGIDPAEIEHEVQDGDELDMAGGLKAIHVPGHCAGQLAFLWPQHGGVLFAADVASNMFSLGWSVIYEDLAEGKRSLAKLAKLDFAVACFGHGRAIVGGAAERFRKKWDFSG
ncbi:MAG: MBL fold metallo-hydrolase [Anaerolineae bacterium]|nr:MBL fold metallo-hydrolase [Anaerolineae bacterium]